MLYCFFYENNVYPNLEQAKALQKLWESNTLTIENMNKDFHYYGTYYAARFAGYSKEDAEEIAWAAQMVDDFTEANFGAIFNSENITYTCEALSDTAKHELNILSDVNNKVLQKTRRIWATYHKAGRIAQERPF